MRGTFVRHNCIAPGNVPTLRASQLGITCVYKYFKVVFPVWYSGEEFFIDFLPLFLVLFITQVFPVIFPLYFFLLRTHFFNTKYFVLPYSIDVISTLSYCDRQFVILKYSTNLTKPQESCISPGTRPPTHPVGLRVEAAMVSAEINAELVCPLSTPSFPPGTHDYGTKRHNPIEANMRSPDKKPRLSSVSIAKLKNHTMKSTLMAPKWTAEWGQRQSSTANSRMVRQPAATCPKAYQTTAPSLLLMSQPSLWHMGPVHHDLVVYSESISCLQAIECKDDENPFICHIMDLLWLLSDRAKAHVFDSAGY